jgi:hypothetical protein
LFCPKDFHHHNGVDIKKKVYIDCGHIVNNVYEMSEPEKRTPISVYLTPRAATILRDYNMGSGYGSVSRTVEEIILAFDAVYKNIQTIKQAGRITSGTNLSREEKANLFLVFVTTLLNIDNAISRLQPEIAKKS